MNCEHNVEWALKISWWKGLYQTGLDVESVRLSRSPPGHLPPTQLHLFLSCLTTTTMMLDIIDWHEDIAAVLNLASCKNNNSQWETVS